MAALPLQPPASFDFSKPDEWPKWIKRFEQYRIASGIAEESDTRQISTLLYCLGDEAEDVLRSTNVTEEERKKYDKVLQKLNNFFKIRKNVILERAKFNRRCQLPGESVEQYITSLYHLAEHCAYGDLAPEMIRDRLVVGISDLTLSERLCADAELTLEKAKTIVRTREVVQEHRSMLQHHDKGTVDQLRKSHKYYSQKRHSLPTRHKSSVPPKPQSTSEKCKRCGNKLHRRDQCPAKDVECHKCKKKGHFSSQCLSKRVEDVTSQLQEDDLSYLTAVGCGNESSWTVNIAVNGELITFKVDTGAEVTAITESALTQLGKLQLHPATKSLFGPDRKPLKVLGQTCVTLSYNGKSCKHDVLW